MYLHSTLRGYCSQSVSANKVSQLNSQRYVVHWDHFKSERQLQDVCSNSRYTLSPKVLYTSDVTEKGRTFQERGRKERERELGANQTGGFPAVQWHEMWGGTWGESASSWERAMVSWYSQRAVSGQRVGGGERDCLAWSAGRYMYLVGGSSRVTVR